MSVVAYLLVLAAVAVVAPLVAVVVPIPVGYDRGTIVWNTWCGTGRHWHTCYWHGRGRGFQTTHPDDVGGDR